MPFNTIIAKTNAKGKVIDFRDGLVPANAEDYAQIFGTGGSKHAPSAVIRVTICDYSVNPSKTVSANLQVSDAVLIAEVAKSVAIQLDSQNEGSVCTGEIDRFLDEAAQSYGILCQARNQGRILTQEEFCFLGQKLEQLCANLQACSQKSTANKQSRYSHTQERVNIYKKGSNPNFPDFAPVNKLSISYQAIRKDGSKAMYPWIVKITNGYGRVKSNDLGGTSYDSFQLEKEAFINVSAIDMFRMMNNVVRYIDVASIAYGLPLISAGVQLKNNNGGN